MTTNECEFYLTLACRFSTLEGMAMKLAQGGTGIPAEVQKQRDEFHRNVSRLFEKLGLPEPEFTHHA